jgi:phage repressor protein C with HTH and peptisase S24 domain
MFTRTVLVEGPSMLPTLRDGDCLLIRPGARIRPGDVVVARFRERPSLLVVKRAVTPSEGGWLLASDNPAVEGHGLTGGIGDVEARVVLRYWPWPVRRLS